MSKVRWLSVIAVGCAALFGCSEDDPLPLSQLNLDTPIDVSFACFGGLRITDGGAATPAQEVRTSAMPTTACDARSKKVATGEPAPVPAGQEDLTMTGGAFLPNVDWYGLILEQVPGTVALARFPTKPSESFGSSDAQMLDADPLTPGVNSISVGEDPVAIVTDRAGCYAVTANAGSCDLSALDVTTALDSDPAVRVDRFEVKNGSGQAIRAKPAAMAAGPSETLIGKTCLAAPTGIMYVAYPGCHIVAAVDSATGMVRGGIQYDAAGVPSIIPQSALANLSCPDECSTGVQTAGTRPTSLALEFDARKSITRLAIGAENAATVAVVELNIDLLPTSVTQLALANPTGKLGVTSLALSPVIGMGGAGKVIDESGPEFQFVYATTTDRTVRVGSVGTVGAARECETQADARQLRKNRSVSDLACLQIGATTPRRAGARGPGIELPGDVVPLSVAFVRSPEIEGDTRLDETPDKLIGYFGFITATNGATFIATVDDDNFPDLFDDAAPLARPMLLVAPHQLRDGLGQRGATVNDSETPDCDSTGPVAASSIAVGGPRIAGSPARTAPPGSVSLEKLTLLPTLRQLRCALNDEERAINELAFSAPTEIRDVAFPDLAALADAETWSFAWEGQMTSASRQAMAFSDTAGVRLVDPGKSFCEAGVEKFDIAQMRGCDPQRVATTGSGQNLDCPAGYGCFLHPLTQIPSLGTCMLADEGDRLANACREYMNTIRRYTVSNTSSGELRLVPRRHELRTSPVDGCVSNEQCEALGDYALRNTNAQHPGTDMTTDPRTWTCELDATRPPLGGTGKRCQLRCDADPDCVAGTVCNGATAGQAKSGFCMESVIPPQSCVNAPQRYDLRTGDSFAVAGTRSGFVHPITADANGQCVNQDPVANRLSIGRIPLAPPPCGDPATTDPLTGALQAGGFEPNPCSLTVAQTDVSPRYVPGTCTLEEENPSALVDRQAPAIRFRNRGMNLTFTDPYYSGDATCIADRGGTLGKIPLLVPGYVLSFRQVAGRGPLVLPLGNVSFPAKVVRGPTNSIWVVDQGDFLATQLGQANTRGKVFRVEARLPLGTPNVLQ